MPTMVGSMQQGVIGCTVVLRDGDRPYCLLLATSDEYTVSVQLSLEDAEKLAKALLEDVMDSKPWDQKLPEEA
jgi:hypothetical protein